MQNLLTTTRRPDITFHANGLIRISSRIARILCLSPGDSINIAISGDEYLLFAVRHVLGRHEGRCRPSKKGSGNFCANSARLCRSLFEALGLDCSAASFMAGESLCRSDIVYLPLITHLPLCRKN